MKTDGPILESLTHRLSECPEEFLYAPRIADSGVISVEAISADHLRAMGQATPAGLPANFDAAHLSVIAVTAWLLHDDWFLARPDLTPHMEKLFSGSLQPLSQIVKPADFVTDPDRREELARLCLTELGLRPQGESAAQARDRMSALDSLERLRVLRDTLEAEARAEEVRKQMAKRAAEEAAAKETRE
jgi:hypothetical protein